MHLDRRHLDKFSRIFSCRLQSERYCIMRRTGFSFCSTICFGAVAALGVLSPAVVRSATITLPAVADTTILPGANQLRTFGGAPTFAVGQLSNVDSQRSILRFDVSSLSGQYSSIDSITLRLFFSSKAGTNERRTEVYEIAAANAAWVEGTNVGGGVNKTGASWLNMSQDTAPGGGSSTPPINQIPWIGGSGLATAGTAYNSTLLASQNFLIAPAADTSIDFVLANVDLTDRVDDWIVLMPGFLLFDSLLANAGTGLERIVYHSKEATTPSLRPELIVEYQAVPEPNSMLLAACGLLMVTGYRWRKGNLQRRCAVRSQGRH